LDISCAMVQIGLSTKQSVIKITEGVSEIQSTAWTVCDKTLVKKIS